MTWARHRRGSAPIIIKKPVRVALIRHKKKATRARGVPGPRAEEARKGAAIMAPKYTAVSASARLDELTLH